MAKAGSQAQPARPTWLLKGALLATLAVQHCLVGVITRKSQTTGTGQFVSQTGVILQETLKICISFALAVASGEKLSTVADSPKELARASVPALLYLAQNNLQYVALAYLEPATYVVTYQLKILSTAVLSVALLGRRLSGQRWGALLLLATGVSLVQLSVMAAPPAGSASGQAAYDQRLLGLAAVLTTCVLSGMAGVYTEMMLKDSSVSLWVRNVQLAAWSLLFGAVGLTLTDAMPAVRAHGFFNGYNGWVAASVINNSCGGLLIAVIIKKADNILKNFATSISIVLATAASIVWFDLEASSTFLGGVMVVCCSTFLYGITQSPLQLLQSLISSEGAKGGKAL